MLQIEVFTFNPLQENTYVVYNNKGNALIIDPGCFFGAEREELDNFLTSKQLTPLQLINTHCHLDHVFGNKYIHKKYGLELYIHPNEETVLAFAPQSGMQWGIPFENYNGPLHFFNEGDTIQLDEDKLDILLLPGHSPGSVGFYSAAQNFIISGDVLFRESVGRTDLPGGDTDTLVNSILTKMYALPNETQVYSGHGPVTTIGHEKQFNPYVKGDN